MKKKKDVTMFLCFTVDWKCACVVEGAGLSKDPRRRRYTGIFSKQSLKVRIEFEKEKKNKQTTFGCSAQPAWRIPNKDKL